MLSAFTSLILLAIFFFSTYFFNFLYLKYNNQNNSKDLLKNNFMGSVLIIFGLLKLYDIQKFANIFQKYDIISSKIPQYAYIYPFIEIALGISYLKKYNLKYVNIFAICIMVISIISVILSLIEGKKLRCGCMGSFFHIPLSYVTISENIIMLLMISSTNQYVKYLPLKYHLTS